MSAVEQQNVPQNIPGIIPGPWTDVQCLDFCSIALRHVVVEGDLRLSDINDALRYMAEKYEAPTVDPMHIDDRVRMISEEPAHITVVFKLPSLNDAHALIKQLPYGEKALGTEAVVFGMTQGNLMESLP